ncbi:hypothetical protein SCLARK_00465 [Spiroplasma clarkii]|nr:hypothetical protein [Spiroplasma clarkii]ARU91179.1 hypothetical protein SCLARK_00465 [Spiroplasma clarkii]
MTKIDDIFFLDFFCQRLIASLEHYHGQDTNLQAINLEKLYEKRQLQNLVDEWIKVMQNIKPKHLKNIQQKPELL